MLTIATAAAFGLCLFVAQSAGAAGGAAALAVGFFNSIIVPNHLYADACAAIPLLMGLAADSIGLARAFFVPLVAYLGIVLFAAAAAKAGRPVHAAALPIEGR